MAVIGKRSQQPRRSIAMPRADGHRPDLPVDQLHPAFEHPGLPGAEELLETPAIRGGGNGHNPMVPVRALPEPRRDDPTAPGSSETPELLPPTATHPTSAACHRTDVWIG